MAADLPKTLSHSWRGPTIAEIARESGVGTSTIDRVVNGRAGVREVTRKRVMAAVERLNSGASPVAHAKVWRIAFLSDSGASYNTTLAAAIEEASRQRLDVACPLMAIATAEVEPVKFANLIERTAEQSDALVIVAREDLIINRAVRNVIARKVPVVCLTTDLPATGRMAYVGNDQAASGATAAYLMGMTVGARQGKILLVYSAPYRVQEERELGFRRVLRAEFARLSVDERVNSNDDTDYVYRNVMRYITEHGAPAGIYNVAGGNTGVGRALRDNDLVGKTIFIGHELNANSRMLLETGVMHFALGHDVAVEVSQAIALVLAHLNRLPPPANPLTRVRVYTKYSCN